MASSDLRNVLRNMDRENAKLRARIRAGLSEAGLKLQAASQLRVPVDTGNLKASAFTRRDPGGALAVDVGYTSSYAIFVHENREQKLKGQPRKSGTRKGRYWDPQGRAGPNFLRGAMNDNRAKLAAIIAHHSRIP